MLTSSVHNSEKLSKRSANFVTFPKIPYDFDVSKFCLYMYIGDILTGTAFFFSILVVFSSFLSCFNLFQLFCLRLRIF